MIAACRDKNRRVVEFSPDRPSEWQPEKVLDPELASWNIHFTTNTAFEFLADKMATNCLVQKTALRKPPGASGYEMEFPWPDGRVLYAKLELVGEFVHGRSFHFSVKTGK